MLSLKFTEASKFQNSLLSKDFALPISKKKYFIGRGEELQEKATKDHGIIDLTKFDNTLSRVHACLHFSPAWFYSENQKIPKFLEDISFQGQQLPLEVVQKIWEFLKPQKICILKDLKSKVGIFSKVEIEEIKSEMIIEFVHQSFIQFEYFEQYESFKELESKVKSYQESNNNKPVIFGNLEKIRFHYGSLQNSKEKQQLLKIWHLKVKQVEYVLLMQEGMILRIGRSSHCEIQIKDTAISRYQSYLKCENLNWKVHDGNMLEKSKNGTWKREKSILIPISKLQKDCIKNFVKIGTIKCEIEIIEKFEWLKIEKIANGDVSKSFIEIGMGKEANTQEEELFSLDSKLSN